MIPVTARDDKRVRVYFEADVRDLTPNNMRPAVHVLYVPVSPDPRVLGLCALVLSKPELQRIDRTVGAERQAEFAQRRAFRRFCASIALQSGQLLSEIEFQATAKGRPYLGDTPRIVFQFFFLPARHSGGLVVGLWNRRRHRRTQPGGGGTGAGQAVLFSGRSSG